MFHNYKIKNLNIKLILAVVSLTLIGIAVVSSANEAYQRSQMIGMVLGIAAMTVVALIDYDFILQFSWLYYGLVLVLLGMIFTPFGYSSGGATRWIKLGGFRFQPSEISKILLILFFAALFIVFNC